MTDEDMAAAAALGIAETGIEGAWTAWCAPPAGTGRRWGSPSGKGRGRMRCWG